MLMPDGTMVARVKGTPQGGPISPLIANIFLHHGFDAWMTREYPGVQFERFADDVVVHCVTERQARQVREAIGRRLVEIGLKLHPDKTRIVYCKDGMRRLGQPAPKDRVDLLCEVIQGQSGASLQPPGHCLAADIGQLLRGHGRQEPREVLLPFLVVSLPGTRGRNAYPQNVNDTGSYSRRRIPSLQ